MSHRLREKVRTLRADADALEEVLNRADKEGSEAATLRVENGRLKAEIAALGVVAVKADALVALTPAEAPKVEVGAKAVRTPRYGC